MIALLLEHNADQNVTDKEGRTPLIIAASYQDNDTVPLLIKHGAIINRQDKKGYTALMRIVVVGDIEKTKLLIDHGAEINKQNKYGETALMGALESKQFQTEYLIDSHADVTLRNKKNLSALNIAVKTKNRKIAQKLLDHGADPAEFEEINTSIEALPQFKYYDEKALKDVLEYTGDSCDCCKKARGVLYNIELNVEIRGEEEVLQICPWCIAGGQFAKKFKSNVNNSDLEPMSAQVSKDALDELRKKTPAFLGWQQERWLTHCNQLTTFLGIVGWEEIQSFYQDIDIVDPIPDSYANPVAFLQNLHKQGDTHGYLFKCTHCQALMMYWDAS